LAREFGKDDYDYRNLLELKNLDAVIISTPWLWHTPMAAWSAITPLSEVSIANNGEVQDFLDFTRAQWIKRQPYNWIKDTW
jgi:hypothetical protein